MSNFSKLIKLNAFDEFTGFGRDLVSNPYRYHISFNGNGYEIFYNGSIMSISTDIGRKFLSVSDGMVSINIKESMPFKPSIDRFIVPNEIHPFSFLWKYDCWSRRRITSSNEKFDSIYNKIDPSKRILLTSKSMDLLYEERDGKYLRKVIKLKDRENFDDVINLVKIIIDMNKSYPIGWDIDYISLEDNIKYDLILEKPFYQPYDQDGSIRKKLYKELLNGKEPSLDITLESRKFFANR